MMCLHLLLALVSPIVAMTKDEPVPPTGDYIRLELRTSGTSCYIEEPFWIDVLTINVTDDTIRIPYPTPEEEIMVFDGRFHGADVNYEGISFLSTKTPIAQIAPGDTVLRVFNLWQSFFRAEKWERLPKTGTVTLSARLGGARSNEVSFDIEAPAGTDSAAFEEWRKYRDSYWVYPLPTEEERLDYLRDLVSSYPNTGYAEWALYELMRKSAKSNDDPRKQEYARMMIEEHPSSGFVGHCLSPYLNSFARAERDSALNTLLAPDKPFRMRMIVSNALKGHKYP